MIAWCAKHSQYFENEILRKRPYLRKEWRIRVVDNARGTTGIFYTFLGKDRFGSVDRH